MKQTHILIAVGLIIIALVAWAVIDRSSSGGGKGERIAVAAVSESDWQQGPQDAPLTLIEYSDFQCPACGSYFPIVKQLLEEFDGKLRVVYRHFPLRSIHPNAQLAAQAAEAAGAQGAFWEMHDMLFERQSLWSGERNPEELFKEFATELKLDAEQFVRDMTGADARSRVNNHYTTAIGANLNSTPTFFLNGKRITPTLSYQGFRTLLENELQ